MNFNLQQQKVDTFSVKIMVICLLGAIALVCCLKRSSVFRSACIENDAYAVFEYKNDFSYGFSNDKGSFEIGIGWEVLGGYSSRGFSPPPNSYLESAEENQISGFCGQLDDSYRLSESVRNTRTT